MTMNTVSVDTRTWVGSMIVQVDHRTDESGEQVRDEQHNFVMSVHTLVIEKDAQPQIIKVKVSVPDPAVAISLVNKAPLFEGLKARAWALNGRSGLSFSAASLSTGKAAG